MQTDTSREDTKKVAPVLQQLAEIYIPTELDIARARKDMFAEQLPYMKEDGRWQQYMVRAEDRNSSETRQILAKYRMKGNGVAEVSRKQIARELAEGEITQTNASKFAAERQIGQFAEAQVRLLDSKQLEILSVLIYKIKEFPIPKYADKTPSYFTKWVRNRLDYCITIASSTGITQETAIASLTAMNVMEGLSEYPLKGPKRICKAVTSAATTGIPLTLFNFECFDLSMGEDNKLRLNLETNSCKVTKPYYKEKEVELLQELKFLNIPVRLIKLIPDEELSFIFPVALAEQNRIDWNKAVSNIPTFVNKIQEAVSSNYGEVAEQVAVMTVMELGGEVFRKEFEDILEKLVALYPNIEKLVPVNIFREDLRFRKEKNRRIIGLPDNASRDLLMTQMNFATYSAELRAIRRCYGSDAILLLNESETSMARFSPIVNFFPGEENELLAVRMYT